jgi:hypothetical protein
MKIYVKTDGPVPEGQRRYITPGKVYEVEGTSTGGMVKFDDGSWCWIYIPESSHLDCEPWTLCDQHGNPVAETDWKALAGELAEKAEAYVRLDFPGDIAPNTDICLEGAELLEAIDKYKKEVRA